MPLPCFLLSFDDVRCNNSHNPSIISINIKKSKTDQSRRGVKVFIGSTNDDLCPVLALLKYLEFRGSKKSSLFQWHNGTPLSHSRFVKEVKSALVCSGVAAANYSGHSFRIGAAITAAAAGIEDSTIQTLGRWKSSAYLVYIRIPPSQLARMSVTLSTCQI